MFLTKNMYVCMFVLFKIMLVLQHPTSISFTVQCAPVTKTNEETNKQTNRKTSNEKTTNEAEQKRKQIKQFMLPKQSFTVYIRAHCIRSFY